MEKARFYKRILILLFITVLFIGFFTVDKVKNEVQAAEGDLLWTQTSNPSGLTDVATRVVLDNTGFYIIGYDAVPGTNLQWRIEKRNLNDGSPIWTQTSNPSGSADYPQSIAIDSTGIYIVGDDRALGISNARWRMEKRSLTDGSLIWSQISNPGAGSDSSYDVAVDSTGVFIVGSQSISPPGRIEKRDLNNGNLLWTQTSNPSSGTQGIAIDSTGFYVMGADSSPGNNQWRIEKRNLTSGSLIWSQVNNPSATDDRPMRITIDTTGIYIAGVDTIPGATNSQWRIEKRDLNNGSLTWSQTSNPSASADIARGGIAIDTTGVYIAGTDSSPGNYQWRIEKRNLTNGSLIWSQVNNPSANNDEPHGLVIGSSGIYVVGYDQTLGNTNDQWRIEKREAPPLYQDIGLRVFNGAGAIVAIAAEIGPPTFSLRISKNGVTYGVALVSPGDPNDSGARIQTSSGIEALRKYP